MEGNITTLLILQILVPVVIAFIASSGFWIFLMGYREKKSAQTELLLGLAHDRIVSKGMYFIELGSITQDEYENLNVYLYKPYEKLGGNGSAKRIMLEVDRLPIRKHKQSSKLGDTQP